MNAPRTASQSKPQEKREMWLVKDMTRVKNWRFINRPTQHPEKLLVVDALGNPQAVNLKSWQKKKCGVFPK